MELLKGLFESRDRNDGIDARLDAIIARTTMLEERRRSHAEVIRQRNKRAKVRRIAWIGFYAKSRKNAKRGRVMIKRKTKPVIFTAGQIFRAIIGR